MIYHLANKIVKFETGRVYSIQLKDGVKGTYKVLGLHNPSVGKPALKLRNKDYGWICYINVEEIVRMD